MCVPRVLNSGEIDTRGVLLVMCAFCVLLILLVPIPTISLQVVIILLSELYECLPFVAV